MRTVAAVLLGVVLLAACGGTRTQADQDKDGRLLADALRAVWTDGTGFKLDQRLQLVGGDIPSGQAFQLHGVVGSGVLKGSSAHFGFRLVQGQQAVGYDMLIADGLLYVKRQDATSWKDTPLSATTTLLTALRLDLVRETVLLASSVSSGALGHIDAGFARKYVVRPAPDQLEELQSMSVQGAAEDQFLKTATAELDVYLLFPGDKLGRVEVHLSGTDPSNGEKQAISSTLDLHPAKVGAITAPTGTQQVDPSSILT
jgi:hypothetical protein